MKSRMFLECQRCEWTSSVTNDEFTMDQEYEDHFLNAHWVFPIIWTEGIDFEYRNGELYEF